MKHITLLLFVGLAISPALNSSALGRDGSSPAIDSREDRLVPSCDAQTCMAALEEARAYLIETARPGGTMMRQGPDLAVERLHPEFAKRLASAIRAARQAGLADAGVFSAYRPPVFGIGGFADKYYSLHAYGLAVDMHGIGRPGSAEAQRWHEIAAAYGIVCPYGYRSRVEWNHCQPTHLQTVKSQNPLRQTITGAGPIDLERMFEVGMDFLAAAESTITSVVADRNIQTGSSMHSGGATAVRVGWRRLQRAVPNRRALSRLATRQQSPLARRQQPQRKAGAHPQAKVASLVKRPK